MDAPVITNIVDLLDRDGLTGAEPGPAEQPMSRLSSLEKHRIFLIRPKSFTAESAEVPSRSRNTNNPRLGATGSARVTNRL